jgi:hypothetical protein
MPLSGNLASINLADNMTYALNRSLDLESATVGLFTTTLHNGNHTGFMRYTFPGREGLSNNRSTPNVYPAMAGAQTVNEHDAHVLVDLTHVLPAYSSMAYSQKYVRGELHIRASSSGSPSYYGSATYTGGWPQPDAHQHPTMFSEPNQASFLVLARSVGNTTLCRLQASRPDRFPGDTLTYGPTLGAEWVSVLYSAGRRRKNESTAPLPLKLNWVFRTLVLLKHART